MQKDTPPEQKAAPADSALHDTQLSPGPPADGAPRGGGALAQGAQVGRFVVAGRLGQGGMGVVYTAYDPVLDRKVALKLLRLDNLKPEHRALARGRLAREARAAAKLSHPNVVAVYEAGDAGDDESFVAMELVEGQTLAEWQAEGPHPWRAVLKKYLQAAEGLAAAHQAGLVHRDFKPQNVLAGKDGRVRVADFGLARALAPGPEPLGPGEGSGGTQPSSASGEQLTQPGAVLGTPAYMAPEQFLGKEADPRSDQFSFCVALFEALYGARPFDGRTIEAVLAQMREGRVVPTARRKAPRALRAAVLRGLSWERDGRHPDMAALIAELERFSARRAFFFRLNLAAATVAVVLAAALAGRTPAAACGRAGDGIFEVWSPGRRAALAQRFGGAEGEGGPLALADRYAALWRDARAEACAAAEVTKVEPFALWERRAACLERLRRRLDTTLSVLEGAPRPDPAAATEALAALAPAAGCSGAELSLLADRSAPPAAVAAQVGAGFDRLAALAARRYFDAGGARAELEAALPGLEALGFAPLEAEALKLLGQLRLDLHAAGDAASALERAVLAAERAGDDALRLTAELELARAAGWRDARFADAGRHLARASAALERLGRPASLEAEVTAIEATLLFRQSRYAEAKPRFLRAIELESRLHGAEHPRVARARSNLAQAHKGLGELALAEEAAREAARSLAQTAGPAHRWTRVAQHSLGTVLLRRARPSEAREAFALSVPGARLGHPGPEEASAHARIALCLAHEGRFEEASVALGGVEALLDQGTLRDESLRLDTEFVRSEIELGGLQLEHAARRLEERARATEALLGRGEALVNALVRAARVQLERGQYAAAQALLARAETVELDPATTTGLELAGTRGELAARTGRCAEVRAELEATLAAQLEREPDPTRLGFTRAALIACPVPGRDDSGVRAALLASLVARPPAPIVAEPWRPLLMARLAK